MPAADACYLEHEAIKADPVRWATLEPVGFQDDGEGGALEMKNCRCGSTLAVELPRAEAAWWRHFTREGWRR